MPEDIAVFVGESGETTSLHEKGKIIVYRKKRGEWDVLREKAFILDKSLDMKELRRKMTVILEFLGDCRVFVGHSVNGVPYFELEKCKFRVWEFAGKPIEFLDYVQAEEEGRYEQKINGEKNNIAPAPVETSSGCYRISIKEIQENATGITSKQALLPFLRKGGFYSLEVLCNHVPPWLEAELLSSGYSGDIEKISNKEVKITVARSCCREI